MYNIVSDYCGAYSTPTRIYFWISQNRAVTAVILLIAIALVYWVWFGLSSRVINDDEGISILAAQSILQEGIPRLPALLTLKDTSSRAFTGP